MAFTTRAAALALAFCAVLLTLAYPGKEWLAQRSDIQQAQSDQVAMQRHVDALERQHRLAQTPAQTMADARSRLHYVLPGQRNYIPVAPLTAPAPAVTRRGRATVPVAPNSTWYARLWRTDVTAGKG